MKMLVRLLGGLGLRFEAELVQHRTVDAVIGGVRVPVAPMVAQALAVEQERRLGELARVTATAAAAVDAALAREAAALEIAAAAESLAQAVEAELAGERAARAADVAHLEAELSAARGDRDARRGVLLHLPCRGSA